LGKQKSHARKSAWLTSLRRHYPHQVQGVVQKSDLSAMAAPPHYRYAKVTSDV